MEFRRGVGQSTHKPEIHIPQIKIGVNSFYYRILGSRDVFCTQHVMVFWRKPHLKSRFLAPFLTRGWGVLWCVLDWPSTSITCLSSSGPIHMAISLGNLPTSRSRQVKRTILLLASLRLNFCVCAVSTRENANDDALRGSRTTTTWSPGAMYPDPEIPIINKMGVNWFNSGFQTCLATSLEDAWGPSENTS